VLAVVMIVAAHFILRRFSKKVQTIVLGILSFAGIFSIIFNLVAWNSPLEHLPLHLCAFNAIVLPITVFTKNKITGNLLLVWCLGALFALILNNEVAHYEIFSWRVYVYYFPHVIELGVPLLLFTLGHIKKDPKCILSTEVITMTIYTLVHFAILALTDYVNANQICNPEGNLIVPNYMFSMAATNPLLELFQKLIPGVYWHMYLAVPILVVYLLIVYAPDIIKAIKSKKARV
jgi:uncharacterized membrane protein YwaF